MEDQILNPFVGQDEGETETPEVPAEETPEDAEETEEVSPEE